MFDVIVILLFLFALANIPTILSVIWFFIKGFARGCFDGFKQGWVEKDKEIKENS